MGGFPHKRDRESWTSSSTERVDFSAYHWARAPTASTNDTGWDRAEDDAVGDKLGWVSEMPHRAYLRRPFAVLDAVRAPGPCSTVRSALRARRVSEPRFAARSNHNSMDCGKTGRSVVSNKSSGWLATRL